jgi:hypothetical protein
VAHDSGHGSTEQCGCRAADLDGVALGQVAGEELLGNVELAVRAYDV